MDERLFDVLPELHQGVVTLEEFKYIAHHGHKFDLKTSALWSSVRQVRSCAIDPCSPQLMLVFDVVSGYSR